ncbi:hypothetical protein VOLCADRAFT_106418 [Volvox carteri f. nagariensis]|uniref:Uncharacterized protein n=1 Tax=Volvox carteri f. nagariensis TaxID=3068 RepID=D8U779_VOLCA|nr:uncharacterized protein VOLCADRAFT_106418 [Volvox carteri f. nagariensis]EFJ44437.1 hypothetical protein VOLCADRAFT_106418 [Volvox carteri f. nagariensis]|eukprot:XP_002954544.1 hypothetical protein VOLCADRAFT_106418 [Volvox carteri f. nagariensis]
MPKVHKCATRSNGVRGTNGPTAGACVVRNGVKPAFATEEPLLGQWLPPLDAGARPQEVPVLADATTAATATTAASALAASATSAGHVPSAPPPLAALYSELLSGPGFSYAADGDEVFEADTISLGSGSLGSCGYMLDDDYADDDFGDDDSGDDSVLFSAGTICSGSGKRSDAAALAAAPVEEEQVVRDQQEPLTGTAPSRNHGVRRPVRPAAVVCGGGLEAGLETASAAVDAPAAGAADSHSGEAPNTVLAARSCSGQLGRVGGSGGAVDGAVVVEEFDVHMEVDGFMSSAVLSGSSCESVGSAGGGGGGGSGGGGGGGGGGGSGGGGCEVPSCNSRARVATGIAGDALGTAEQMPSRYKNNRISADIGAGSEPGGAVGTGAFANEVTTLYPPVAMAAAAPALGLGTAALTGDVVTATLDRPSRLPAGGGVQQLHLQHMAFGLEGAAVAAAVATASTATLPLAAAPPALLPPEVYLGFVTQLVEAVRTATRAVDAATCLPGRQRAADPRAARAQR